MSFGCVEGGGALFSLKGPALPVPGKRPGRRFLCRYLNIQRMAIYTVRLRRLRAKRPLIRALHFFEKRFRGSAIRNGRVLYRRLF